MSRNYTVYIHRSKTENKAYVGMTSQKPTTRWLGGSHYKTCVRFNDAVERLGWDNFEHIIFATGLSEKEADHIERSLIALFQTNDERFGYNMQSGGRHGVFANESKEKIRIKAIGRKYSDEFGKKISAIVSGENNPRAKAVKCLNNNMIFNTAKDAAKWCGKDISAICKCCNGSVKSCGVDPTTGEKLVWRYVNDNGCNENDVALVKQASLGARRPVICVTTGMVFSSVSEAAAYYNESTGNISRCCKTGKPYLGKTWRHIDAKELICYEAR